jgi:hypothetical protein
VNLIFHCASKKCRLIAVSSISASLQGRGAVMGNESLRLAAEMRLLGHCVGQPYIPPEMALILLSSVFAEVVNIKETREGSEHYAAACEAIVSVLKAVPKEPFHRALFDKLLDVASLDWHREIDGGRCSALLIQAATHLLKDTKIKIPKSRQVGRNMNNDEFVLVGSGWVDGTSPMSLNC